MKGKSRSYAKQSRVKMRQNTFQDFLARNKEANFSSTKIDPDEYFKETICSKMGIDLNWLQEKDTNKRFRINMIERIRQSEVKSLKAKHIMTDFLATKRRDKSGIVLATGEKELEDGVRNDMFLKVVRLRNQVMARKSKSVSRTHYIAKAKDAKPDNSAKELYSATAHCRKRETLYKKQLASTAENLQRDIARLERSLGAIRSGHLPIRKRMLSLKGSVKEHRRERSLVKSILSKARGIDIESLNQTENNVYDSPYNH